LLEALAAEGGLTGFDAEMTLEVWRATRSSSHDEPTRHKQFAAGFL
jgi:hypothetical protein